MERTIRGENAPLKLLYPSKNPKLCPPFLRKIKNNENKQFTSNILCFYIQYEQVLWKNIVSFDVTSNDNNLYIAFFENSK